MKVIFVFAGMLACIAANVSADDDSSAKSQKNMIPEISAQEFYALPKDKQDSVLIATSRSLVLEHGPDW